jgi:hypothetical protein
LKWYAEERADFLRKLKTTNWDVMHGETVPKIGTNTEREIIKKLVYIANGKTVNDILKQDVENIWYYNATSNWIHSHLEQCVPRSKYYPRYEKKEKRLSLLVNLRRNYQTIIVYRGLSYVPLPR